MRKSIKNYTTTIPVNKTIAEIQELLVAKGAEKVMLDYELGKPTSLMFLLKTPLGPMPVRLPARTEKMQQVFYNYKNSRQKYEYYKKKLTDLEKEQAERTAWKNIKDWIDAQLALIETEMVKIEEVFLPYMIWKENKTVFENFESNNLLGTGEKE